MAVSASFHRNVLLLSQIIQPNDEFKKHFREGMFDKPNSAGFLHMSYYLLTVYDSERFKKLIEWPVTCKKTEAKYRNNVKEYLTIISAENPDIGFPIILMSHLIHAGGSKFTIIMWKLSQVVVRRYIVRETPYNVIYMPKVVNNDNLTKTLFREINAKIDSDILHQHKNISEMESTTKFAVEREKERLNKIISEIFEREHSLGNLVQQAPVHPSIKKCLKDINDEEVIKLWKKNINEGLSRIQKKNKIIKDIEDLTFRANNVILSYNGDAKILDGKQLQKINPQEVSEILSPDMQCLLYQLYKNDKMQLNKFLVLFNFLLSQLHQHLKLNMPDDFTDCSLQVEASCKDANSALNIIQSYLLDLAEMTSRTQKILCEKNIVQFHDDTVLPIMNNMLIMLSPLIKIDTNCNDKETDLQKRLQLTPVEAAHKSLFSRYQRLKENHASQGPKLRENLLVSRINFDDTISTINSEKQYLNIHTMSSRKNLTSFKQAEKYSRLFSTRAKKNNRTGANSSIMSIPCTSKANSTAIANTIDEMHDISEISLNITPKTVCDVSMEFVTPEKFVDKQKKPEDASEMEDVVNDFPHKTAVVDICKTIEVERKNNYDNNIMRIDQTKQRRHSIGDLVERYKKLLEVNKGAPSPILNYTKCNKE